MQDFALNLPTSGASASERIAGLHLGAIWVSEDFDEPLSDEFWAGPDTGMESGIKEGLAQSLGGDDE